MHLKSFLHHIPAGLLMAAALLPSPAAAQVSYTGGVYVQTFDSLAGNAVAGTAAAAAWNNNTTLPGWYASEATYKASNATSGATPTAALFATTASTNTSNVGLFSFGTLNTTDRSLGSRPIAGGADVLYGVRLVNSTTQTLTSATVMFSGEQWFKSGKTTADTILVDYQTGATSIAAGTWTNVPALLFTSGTNTATAATVAGNTVGTNRQGYGTRLTGLNWAPGTELWVRFRDTDNTGDEQGMAIDDFVLTTGDEQGLFFNGKSSYATMGQGPATATAFGASSFTVECRFIRTGPGVTASTGSGGVTVVPLIARGVGEADASNLDANYCIGIDANGRLAADFEQLNATSNGTAYLAGQNFPVTGSTVLQNGVPYHVAATYNAATATWALYVNGMTETLTTALPTFAGVLPRADSIQGLGIGTTVNSTGARAGFFHGIIDEARIWNVARSGAQILADKDNELVVGTGLLARFGMDEASGTTINGTSETGAATPSGTLAGTVLPTPANAASFAPNPAPVVALTTPANGTSAVFPTILTLAANASDTAPGTIVKVEFYNGATKLGEDLAAPYQLTLTTLAEGTYTFTAVALDNNGGTATSSPATFTITPNPQLPPVLTLTSPADALTGAGSSVTLSASIADPEGDASTVTFYGRKRTPLVPGADFVLGTLPDTQYYSQNTGGDRDALTGPRLNQFFGQNNWFVDARDSLNVAFVSHQGDMVQEGNNGFIAANYATDYEWRGASKAMSILENQFTTLRAYGIPWGGAPGNHDQTTVGALNAPNEKWNLFFGTSRWAGKPYFKGAFSGNNSNNYQFFSASGLDFIIFHLDFSSAAAVNTGINTGVIAWVDGLMKAHPHRRAIVTSHYILDAPANTVAVSPNRVQAPFGGPGQRFYDEFKDNPNFFMMLCGHIHNEGRRIDTFEGRNVYSNLQDYQDRNGFGNGWLRYYVFSPSTNQITAKTYNPILGIFETGGDFDPPSAYDTMRNEASEFTMPYDMQGSVSPWIALGTVSAHPSGTTATLAWSGLEKDSTYEWYAVANDGIYSGSSTARAFSTALNPAPAIAITSPVNGDNVDQPNQVTITANPTDDGSIAKVEFFQGNARLGEVLTAPWTFSYTATTGPQRITAVATDNDGAFTLSNVVTMTVTNPNNIAPTVAITAPADLATLISGNIVVSATAADTAPGVVAKVEFYNGTTKIGEDPISPYSITWPGVAIGTYTLTAVATDDESKTTTSAPITITVDPAAPFITGYSQTFDSMGTTGTTPPAGWSVWNNSGGSNSTWTAATGIPASALPSMVAITGALGIANPPTATNNNGFNAGLTVGATDRMLGTSPTTNAGTALQIELTNVSGSAFNVVHLNYDTQRFNAPASVNELQGYLVFYSLDNGASWTNVSDLTPVLAAPGKVIVPNTAGVTTFSGTNIALSSPWNNNSTLRIRWVDDNGVPTSPDQMYGLNNVVVQPGVATPSALTAAPASPAGISVAWTDNANNETGVLIERKASSDTVWTSLATLAANATSYVDTTAAAPTSYDYRVLAFNSAIQSEPSGSAAATAYTPIQLWKLQFLGDANIPDSSDSDGDGLTNAEEFLIGTNPSITGDTTQVTAVEPQGDGSVNLALRTVAGKSYRIEANNQFPTGPWTTVADNIPGTGSTVSVPDAAAAGEPDRVYRVLVLP
jgi:Bacterial Ig domain/Calcineurin-like phosphoesterase